jgi:hypothetical protein
MMPASNARIVFASHHIIALTPVAPAPQSSTAAVSFLLSDSRGSIIGVTQEGVVFILHPPPSLMQPHPDSFNTHKLSGAAACSSREETRVTGYRCVPVTSHGCNRSMQAACGCVFDDPCVAKEPKERQSSVNNLSVVIFFTPPPSLQVAAAELRYEGGCLGSSRPNAAAAPKKHQGCLQAHNVEHGRLLHVFEGCSDDITCVAVSSGDKNVGRFLIAGSDNEGGGGTLFLWSTSPHHELSAQRERSIPLLISVRAHEVFPSCGAVSCIVGRATDAIVAFVGGKIAIFSLVSRSFK